MRDAQERFIEREDGGWTNVEREGYVVGVATPGVATPGVATGVVRHTLIGGRKDDDRAPGPRLEVRYFELPPGTVTRLEKHEHEHFVIVGEGVGHAIVGEEVREVQPHDVVYVGPWEVHQFVNRGDETFGFFCTVTAVRDFSQKPSAEELAGLYASPAGAFIDPDGAPPPRRHVG